MDEPSTEILFVDIVVNLDLTIVTSDNFFFICGITDFGLLLNAQIFRAIEQKNMNTFLHNVYNPNQ